ncbi:MAG: bacillithiol biosynthesis deacetylase BshB1 [Gemmatimonadaceae bacterium]|jgi:bacillithiol biosynthesis deacetylase BshB1|nr:bacillithiol biosynthesis deacetylase BshB1 [Gemmatimonadaceae bacterium]
MALDILAIGPHPDDVELLCGGTLAVSADLGRRIGILDLTLGETATRGTVALRQGEAAEAAKILGVEVRENLGLPDAGIVNDPPTRERLAIALRRLAPRVVIAPAIKGRHPDHTAAAQLVRDACFVAGLQKVAPDVPRHRPFKVLHAIAYREDYEKPTFVVDVTAGFARKLAAIAAYRSQFDGLTQAGEVYPNGEPLADIVTHQAAHYGTLVRCRYGEPFWTWETMRVADVAGLEVSTF